MVVDPVLRIEDLQVELQLKRSVVRPVENVSLRIDANEMVGVVGETGCGKTMTALSIIRMLPGGGRIVRGNVTLAGRELTTLSNEEMRRIRGDEIGMVFQDPFTSLNPTMPIGKQISQVVRRHRGLSHAEAAERAIEVLNLVGLPHARERAEDYPHQCSGGIRQRVMIAMALSCAPKLLIADEPTTALDVSIQRQILDLIDDLRNTLGMAVLLVSHDLGVVARHVDRVAVMYAGQIAEYAPTSDLFSQPRHPYTEALFEALPERASARSGRLYSIPGMPPDLSAGLAGCRYAPRCRYARSDCTTTAPALAEGAPGHRYACHYPVQKTNGSAQLRNGAMHDRVSPAGTDRPAEPLLAVRRLAKEFPVTRGAVLQRRRGTISAVADVSFDVGAGETFGLVGESGCGKTTIGRIIAGLEKPTSGGFTFDGIAFSHLRNGDRRRARNIQLMFQDSSAAMDPRMRLGSTLREPLAVQRIGGPAEQRRRVRELLDRVGLPASVLDRYPHELSGGQRQRLALARVLTLYPRLIVADEPVSAMDMSVQAQILNLMHDLQRDLGLTYLLISHDLAVVRHMSNRIGVVYLGKLVEIGPTDELYRRPAHHYTRGLIDSAPVADPASERRKARGGIRGEPASPLRPPSGCRFRTRCPSAQEICGQLEPPLRPFGAHGHLAACHFPLRPTHGHAAN